MENNEKKNVNSEAVQAESAKEKEKRSKRVMIVIIVILLLALGALGGYLLLHKDVEPAVKITTSTDELKDPDATGQLGVKVNSTVQVDEGTMQNLNFYNNNKNRYMKCKIKLEGAEDGDYIFESPFVASGTVMNAATIDENKLKGGKNNAIAEVYSYSDEDEKTQIGQVNVKIVLVK